MKKILVALSMLLPMSVFAAGLGKLNMDSGIGEPLQANIELLEVSAKELSSITAAIASEEIYARQGIDRPASHNNIRIEITKNASGRSILKLKSRVPIDEPFLDMLIQLDWSTGRLLREYTVLLDPPGYDPVLQPIEAPVVQSDAQPNAASVDAASNTTTNKVTTADATSINEPYTPGLVDDYITQKGDTLSKIAREMKPANISLDQMLIALYNENEDAFSDGNINRLNVGKVIRAPSMDLIEATSRSEASREVKVQTENWNVYRNKLAGIIADEAPISIADDEMMTQSADGTIKSAAEDKSMPKEDGPKDVVKLSTAEGANSVEAKSLQEKVAALQEEVIAREKSLKEAQDRTADLEKQIADMQKLLALKSDVMTSAQDAAAADNNLKSGEASTNEGVKKPSDPAQIERETAEVKPAAAKTAVQKTKPKKTAVAKSKAKPAKQVSFVDRLLSFFSGLDTMLLAVVGGLVALLLGGWAFLRNRRKKNLEGFEQGIMSSGGLKANTVFGNTSGASVDTGDTSFLTDFSQSANGNMIDTHDVDPIAEAEVYMAYGRDAQAEEILKDAISKEPKRYELHVKLLEMYAASKNNAAFETVSGELYTVLGAEDPIWAKVAEIGVKLEPNNPLYQAGAAVSDGKKAGGIDGSGTPAVPEEEVNFSYDDASKEEVLPEASTDKPLVADFDSQMTGGDALEMPAVEKEALSEVATVNEVVEKASSEVEAPSSDDATSLDFDMSSLNIPSEDAAALTSIKAEVKDKVLDASVSEDAAPALDIGTPKETILDLPEINDVPDIAASGISESVELNKVEEDNALDLSGVSLDVEETGLSEQAPVVEAPSTKEDADAATAEPEDVETKLDLIVAYLEMEDKDGAKELINEVIKEGGPNQRKRAETLLSQIG